MTRIFIEGYELDLSQGLTNQITYAIDDLHNLDSKTTAFTKTIVLPGTANNNKLLGNIFEFNNANFDDPNQANVLSNFNAARNAVARIEVNGLQIMKGVLRLMEIVYDGRNVEYECALFGELGGFINALGNHRIEELDFSAYDHNYTFANITSSWDAVGSTGYRYPLIDYGNVSTGVYGTVKKDFQFNTFKPALFVKEYIDKIIANAGYTYESNFLNTADFGRLIVPNNQAILSSSSNIQLAASPTVKSYNGTGVSFNIEFATTTLGNFTLTSNYLFTYTGTTKIMNLDFYIIGKWIAGGNATIYCKKNGSVVASNYIGPGFSSHFFNASFTVNNISIANGDTINFTMEWSGSSAYTLDVYAGGKLGLQTDTSNLVPLNYGEALKVNNCIPKGIFQKDFFTSILKMFNLLVTEDKYKTNHLIITPYANFYLGQQVDWSDKLDRSMAIKMKPMSEINARFYNLKYKQDNDYYNEDYRKKYNEGYGDRIFDNGLEFAKDTETVEVIFASSVLYGTTGIDKVFPAIYKKSNENTKEDPMDHVVRIMQIKKITSVGSWSIYNVGTNLGSTTNYLYAGHLDSPNAPTNDINFGAPKQTYFTIVSGDLSKNLFNVYYSDYLAEITSKDSRLLTGNFKLNNIDIANLDFSKFYFIDGGLYRLNKITDYTPESDDTTKVELLRVVEKNTFVPDATPNWSNQLYNTCISCVNHIVYKDINPYSTTYNSYRVNNIVIGTTAPTSGNCVTTPTWTSQSYTTCYNCAMYTVYKDTNACSYTYNNYQVNGITVGTSAPSSATCDVTPDFVSQGYSTCVSCSTYLVYKDTKPCSPTYNHYRVNGVDVGTTAPTNGACVTSANWISQGYTTCSGCNNYTVYKDTNVCSSTYNHYQVNGSDVGTTAPTNGMCNTSPILTSQGYYVCFGCTSIVVTKNTNPCSSTYNHYYILGEDQGTTAPTASSCDTAPTWISQGYTTCIGCSNFTVYRDQNVCSSTYGHYQVNGADVGTTAPVNAACNTTPNFVNDGANTVCMGYDLYHMTKDINPCSPSYNTSGVGALIEANSATCGYSTTTYLGFVSQVDGATACAGGDYGQISITILGTSICNATKVTALPAGVWSDILPDAEFWVYKKTGGDFSNRKFKRDGSANSASPIAACVAC